MESIKILVVEDDPISQRVAQLMLKNQGYEVDIAQNGVQVIKQFRPGAYQMIFMDIGLPDLPGTEITRQIRKTEQRQRCKPVPIIALTAHGRLARKECLAAGMNDLLVKPLIIAELNEMLAKWLNNNLLKIN